MKEEYTLLQTFHLEFGMLLALANYCGSRKRNGPD